MLIQIRKERGAEPRTDSLVLLARFDKGQCVSFAWATSHDAVSASDRSILLRDTAVRILMIELEALDSFELVVIGRYCVGQSLLMLALSPWFDLLSNLFLFQLDVLAAICDYNSLSHLPATVNNTIGLLSSHLCACFVSMIDLVGAASSSDTTASKLMNLPGRRSSTSFSSIGRCSFFIFEILLKQQILR